MLFSTIIDFGKDFEWKGLYLAQYNGTQSIHRYKIKIIKYSHRIRKAKSFKLRLVEAIRALK